MIWTRVEKMKQKIAENRKVNAGTLSGSLVVVLLWLMNEFASITPPPEVAAALTVIVSTLVGYVTKEAVK